MPTALKLSISTRKSSYGEDAAAIETFLLQSRMSRSIEEIVNGTGISLERIRTLLYLMRASDGLVTKDEDEKYSLVKEFSGSVYSQPKCKPNTQSSWAYR